MHVAVEAGNADAVDVLLEAGADHSARNRRDRTPLLYAARFGNAEISKKLIAAGAEVNLSVDDGPTPLYQAARYGNHEVVTTLLDAGAEKDRKSAHYFIGESTPLVIAARYGNLSAVSVLIAAGADINGNTTDEWSSPIFYATWLEHEDVVRYILTAGIELDPNSVTEAFSSAVSRGPNDLVPDLLKAGADLNFDGGPPYFLPPMYWAIIRENHEGVDFLLDAKVDPDMKFSTEEKHGRLVVSRNIADAAHKIMALSDGTIDGLERGTRDKQSVSPIFFAVQRSNYVAATILLEAGADINAEQYNGMSLLHFAIDRYNDKKLVRWLLEHGADPDTRDISGASPLHYAAFMGYVDTVQLLLDAGADFNATNLVGMMPADYASCLGNNEMQEMLTMNSDTVQSENELHNHAKACDILLGDNYPWELRFIARISPMLVGIATWDDRFPLPKTTPERVVKDVIRMLCCIDL